MRFWWSSIIFFIALHPCSAQTDDSILLQYHLEENKYADYQPTYMFAESPVLIKYNPVTLVPGGLMFLYQKVISPQIFADCLYELSCSKFSVKAIQHFGIIKGIGLSADRLTRCNQFAGEDIDPIRINQETGKVTDDLNWYHRHKH